MSTLMHGPLLKVERANHHIDQLVAIFREHIDLHVKTRMVQGNANSGKPFESEISALLPRHTATVIGDVVHNLRVALEHAYWVSVRENSGQFGKAGTFPFGKIKADTEASVNGWPATAKPRQDVIRFILDDLEPFEGGRLGLYDLHKLDITDKHDLLLPTLMAFTFREGDELRIHTMGRPPLVLIGGKGESGFIAPPNLQTLFGVENGWFEYTGNIYDAFSVLFGPGPLEKRPVIDTLRMLSQNTAGAIKAIEALLI